MAYQIFLKDNTRFNLCRFYLISAILLSFLIPSLPIDLGISLFHKTAQVVSQIEVESIAVSSSLTAITSTPIETGYNLNIDYIATLGIILLSISLLLLIRFIYRFGSIIHIRTTGHKPEKVEDFKLIFTDKTNNAFSFLGYIFINPLKFNDEEKRLIIEHEREHIRHFHSIDLILIELLIVMQWFNPFAYIARRKLIEIHEFIADNGVIRNGADPHSYQTLLLSVVTSSCLPTAGNQLSALITKKRIAMIGKPLNQTGQWINFLILLPIAAILVIGMSAFTVKESENNDTKKEIVIPETQPFILLNKTDSKIINPIVIENNSTLQVESENPSLKELDLKPILRKEVETLGQNQNPAKEKLKIALKETDNNQSIKEALLKRAKAESKDTYLKDLYFSLPPKGISADMSKVYTSRYSVILKKDIIYSLNYLSGSKDDNLLAIISGGKGDESIMLNQFNFSYSTKKTFQTKQTGAYILEIINLSSKSAEALILLNLVGEVTPPMATDIDVDIKNNIDINSNSPLNQKNNATSDTTQIFLVVEQMPSFDGGDDNKFRAWLAANMQYPKEASDKGMQGRVFVQFVIEKDGSVANAKILRSVDPTLDNEALRVVRSSPKWKPGMQNGKNVRVYWTTPVTFNAIEGNKTYQTAEHQEADEQTFKILEKRAEGEEKGTYLKNFKMQIAPGADQKYSVILKKGITYSFYLFSSNKEDQLKYRIDRTLPDESNFNEKTIDFSYSSNFTFTPELTGTYHLSTRNLSSKNVNSIIYLTLK